MMSVTDVGLPEVQGPEPHPDLSYTLLSSHDMNRRPGGSIGPRDLNVYSSWIWDGEWVRGWPGQHQTYSC